MDVRKGHCWRCEKKLIEDFQKCDKCQLAEYCTPVCYERDKVRHGCVECRNFGPQKCNNCGKLDNVKECAGCNNAWYCNAACQQKHWATHKDQCKEVTSYIKESSARMGMYHNFIGEEVTRTSDPPHYIGDTLAQDFLRLEDNDWSESDKLKDEDLRRDYNVLSAGCGDLRNTLLTVASLPEKFQGKLNVTLDDFDPFVMARNVMFLCMMVWSATREGIASSLATIWYSVHISSNDYDLIKTTLQNLVRMNSKALYDSTNGLVRVQEADVGYLRQVWEGWLALECRREERNSINLQQQRKQIFQEDLGAQVGVPKYLNKMLPPDARFMKNWFDHGIFLPKNADPRSVPFDNPTLTGRPSAHEEPENMPETHDIIPPKSFRFVYCINTDSFPFQVWDCLRVDEFTNQSGLSVMERYHAYVSHHLHKFINFIRLERLKVDIFLANCLDFPNHHLTLKMPKYDRIFTSNLSDILGHGVLLKRFKPLLNTDNKYSTIVTLMMNWIFRTPMADVQNISWAETFQVLTNFNLDTGMRNDLMLDVNNQREYYDNTHWFLAYLRADIMGGGVGVPAMDHVPKLGEVLHYNGMQMRDFRKELNRLVPFQYRVNARRTTLLSGIDRSVEWCLADHGN